MSQSTSTAVATRPEAGDIVQYMRERRTRVEAMLPEGIRFERVLYDVQEAYANEPKLEKCTPESVFRCVVRSQGLGLQIGRTTYLVPKGTRCQLWNHYSGDVELAVRAKAIRYAETAVVYKNERFRMSRGTSPQIEHDVIPEAEKRGPMIGAYAVLWITLNKFVCHFSTVQEADVIRKTKSQQWQGGECPPWYNEKVAVRKALKLIPQNPQLAKWMAEVEALEDGALGDDEIPATHVSARVDSLPAHPAIGAPSRAVPVVEYGDESNAAWEQVGAALRDGPRDEDPYDLATDADPALDLGEPVRRGRNAVSDGGL